MRAIHVSTDQGEVWNMAQLPPVGHEQFYSILAANDEMVFMHVDEPGGEISFSDDKLQINRHMYIIHTYDGSQSKKCNDKSTQQHQLLPER